MKSLVGWSTPLRTNGTKRLSLIPNEIYLDIIERIQFRPEETTDAEYKELLDNLARVCRLFCVICQPRLFSTLKFDGDSDDAQHGNTRLEWRTRLLEGDERCRGLGMHVKECHFERWIPTHLDHAWVYYALLQKNLEAMSYLLNTQSLIFRSVPLESRTLATIFEMPQLNKLVLDGCRSEEDDSIEQPAIRQAGLTSLTILSLHQSDRFIRAVTALVDRARLRKLATNSWTCTISIFSSRDEMPLLAEVNVSVPAKHRMDGEMLLWSALERMPGLTKLFLNLDLFEGRADPNNTLPIIKLSPQSLHTVWCHSWLTRQLVKHCPIRDVAFIDAMLTGEDTITSHLREVEKSTAGDVNSLTLDLLYLRSSLGHHLDTIQSLTIQVPFRHIRGRAFQGLWPGLSHCRSVVHVRFNLSPNIPRHVRKLVDLRWQEELIRRELVPKLYSVTCINFGGLVAWRVGKTRQDWHPVIVDRQGTQERLCSKQSELAVDMSIVRDVDGCLGNLLRGPKEDATRQRLLLRSS